MEQLGNLEEGEVPEEGQTVGKKRSGRKDLKEGP